MNLGSRYDDIGVHGSANYEIEKLEGINVMGVWKFVWERTKFQAVLLSCQPFALTRLCIRINSVSSRGVGRLKLPKIMLFRVYNWREAIERNLKIPGQS